MMADTINQANNCFSISAQTKYTHQPSTNTDTIILPEMANAVICPETGKSLKHQELITKLKYKIKWMRSTANEINRLYNTNTIRFIRRSDIPKGRKVTYGSFVVDIKDHKDEKERTRLTVGGDQIEYPGISPLEQQVSPQQKSSSTVSSTPQVPNSLSLTSIIFI
jgi:hypothetical protein